MHETISNLYFEVMDITIDRGIKNWENKASAFLMWCESLGS